MPLQFALVATRRRAVVEVQTGLLSTRETGDNRKNGQRRGQGRAKRGTDGFQVCTRARRLSFGAFFVKSGGRRRCRPRGRGRRGRLAHKLTRAEGRRRGDTGPRGRRRSHTSTRHRGATPRLPTPAVDATLRRHRPVTSSLDWPWSPGREARTTARRESIAAAPSSECTAQAPPRGVPYSGPQGRDDARRLGQARAGAREADGPPSF